MLPLAQKAIDRLSAKYGGTPKLVRAVRIFLGRKPKEGAEISTRHFSSQLRDRLPATIRVLQTPDPPSTADTVPLLFYYREIDQTSVVYVYYVDAAMSDDH